MKTPQHRSASLTSATCQICGEALRGASPQELLAHLLLNHPREFLQSKGGQNALYHISNEIRKATELFVNRLRGKA